MVYIPVDIDLTEGLRIAPQVENPSRKLSETRGTVLKWYLSKLAVDNPVVIEGLRKALSEPLQNDPELTKALFGGSVE